MRLSAAIPLALIISALLSIASPARAADVGPIERAIEDFLKIQAKSLPGQVSHRIGAINAGALADGCRGIDVKMDPAAPAWGRTHVNVRCSNGAAWSFYVPVQINVAVDYLVSARPLRPGQLIVDADISRRRGDLASLPAGVLTDPAQALGQASGISLPADRPLRADMLRQPQVIKQGQRVKVVSRGAGFQVASEGRAVNNAGTGQVVQVRMASGQVISGIAQHDGTVDVAN